MYYVQLYADRIVVFLSGPFGFLALIAIVIGLCMVLRAGPSAR